MHVAFLIWLTPKKGNKGLWNKEEWYNKDTNKSLKPQITENRYKIRQLPGNLFTILKHNEICETLINDSKFKSHKVKSEYLNDSKCIGTLSTNIYYHSRGIQLVCFYAKIIFWYICNLFGATIFIITTLIWSILNKHIWC